MNGPNKEELTYIILGLVVGLALGFFAANRVSPDAGVAAPQAMATQAGPVAENQELPPNHPPLGAEPVPAPPLPGGGSAAAGSPASTEPQGGTPSLDPLPASSKEQRAEAKYKNLQVLRGIPAERLTSIMFSFKTALGVECTYCHVKDQFEKDEKPAKLTARKMIQMVRDVNGKNLSGIGAVSCNTCHRGRTKPAA